VFVYVERSETPPPIEDQPVVPRGNREDIDTTKCLDKKHRWVRSEVVFGEVERPSAKNSPIFWKVVEHVTWCFDCGRSIREREVSRSRVPSARAYYAMINPERTSYKGIDKRWLERWDETPSGNVHSDWDCEGFMRGGWSR
jgi:hypothetical protein